MPQNGKLQRKKTKKKQKKQPSGLMLQTNPGKFHKKGWKKENSFGMGEKLSLVKQNQTKKDPLDNNLLKKKEF